MGQYLKLFGRVSEVPVPSSSCNNSKRTIVIISNKFTETELQNVHLELPLALHMMALHMMEHTPQGQDVAVDMAAAVLHTGASRGS